MSKFYWGNLYGILEIIWINALAYSTFKDKFTGAAEGGGARGRSALDRTVDTLATTLDKGLSVSFFLESSAP